MRRASRCNHCFNATSSSTQFPMRKLACPSASATMHAAALGTRALAAFVSTNPAPCASLALLCASFALLEALALLDASFALLCFSLALPCALALLGALALPCALAFMAAVVPFKPVSACTTATRRLRYVSKQLAHVTMSTAPCPSLLPTTFRMTCITEATHTITDPSLLAAARLHHVQRNDVRPLDAAAA
jgi:hypothetical protein